MIGKKIQSFFLQEEGQGMTEYGLILGLIAVVVVVALTTMGGTLKSIYNQIISGLGGTPAA
jgi:pilus assembly protein Flp/PilA